MMVTTMVMESIENLSSPLNSTTSAMRGISNTRRPLSTRCCSATWCLDGTSTRRRIRDACSSARLADTVVHVPDARSRYTFRANTFPSPERNIPCHLDIPQETDYFASMNIRLHSPRCLKWMEHSTVYNLNLKRTVCLHSIFSTSSQLPQVNSPILGQPRRHLLHLLHQHLLESTILMSCCDCVIRYSFKPNVVRVYDHLGLCSYYTVIFLNIQLQIIPLFQSKNFSNLYFIFKRIFFGKLN